ncbi:MAG: hypothetical protein HKN13_08635, partial [Rhodothermales bacterium]|nr:hypothetical protein [Rhodothermales bacterium]
MKYRGSILVDSHVHFHRCCDAPAFLSATLSNLYRTGGPRSDGISSVAVLAVVDGQKEDGFERLTALGTNLPAPDFADTDRWISHSTDEQISTGFERDGRYVVIIQGRQIRTRERLEVLAIGTDARIDDGQSIQRVI